MTKQELIISNIIMAPLVIAYVVWKGGVLRLLFEGPMPITVHVISWLSTFGLGVAVLSLCRLFFWLRRKAAASKK